jgi:hypothetical protein
MHISISFSNLNIKGYFWLSSFLGYKGFEPPLKNEITAEHFYGILALKIWTE